MNKFKVGDRVWWIEPSSFNANLYGYRGKRMTGTILEFSPRGATALVELDESSKGRNSCPFKWGQPHVSILTELKTTVDPFARAVNTKVPISHGRGWSTSYLGWTITSSCGMYYADVKFGVVRYQSDNLDDIMEKIKCRVANQGYGEHWRQAQIELRTQNNLYRLEHNIPLYMEYLGYKFYGKDNWYFAINADGDWAVGESRSQIKMRVEFKEGVNPHKDVAI